jgi:hypothetical protein
LAEPSLVTVLYTAHLAGEIALLPRLFTLISQECRAASGPVILLDLGDTCAVEAWVCRATQGRAPFLVLDSMGYDGALIGGPEAVPIPPSSLRQLLGKLIMPVIVWNRTGTITKRGITVTLAPGNAPLPDQGPVIRIDRSTAALPESGAPGVMLGDVAQGQLARVDLAWPEWFVQSARVIELEVGTPVDPTVAAVVELVENEARTIAQQGGEK